MLDRSRSRDRSKTGGAFSPAGLFVTGAQGAWYDPSDFSTLFQNSTGTTPVTAVEQPVRLMLDRSRGLVLGGELVTNGTFNTDTTGWSATAPATATWSGGAVNLARNSGSAVQNLFQLLSLTVGRTYLFSITITALTNSVSLFATNGGVQISGTINTTGTFSFYYTWASGNDGIYVGLGGSITATATVDNVSVRELPGNHALAPNDASRPVLRSRYNLLTFSEQFDNAVWINTLGGTGLAPTVTANAGTDPLGGSTADRLQFSLDGGTATADITRRRQNFTVLANENYTYTIYLRSFDGVSSYTMHIVGANGLTANIVVTDQWQRFTVTASNPVVGSISFAVGLRGGQTPTNSNTADILAWGAQLLTSADQTSTGGAYQRVAAATDYDTSNPVWRPYLAFDGSDDGFGTSAIDFSGTDEMTVFAGVTKLSDVARGMLVELSATGANAGAFNLGAPDGASATYAFGLSGTTTSVAYVPTGYAAPITNVLSCVYDLGGALIADELKPRINGVLTQTGGSGSAAGGGNFLNAALFIGRRNNTSLPFNGRLTSLIVLGRTATAAEISATEQWVAGKTGVTL